MENELKAKESELNRLNSEMKKMNDSKIQFRLKETELDKYTRKFLSKIQNMEGNLLEIENSLKNLEFGHIKVLVIIFLYFHIIVCVLRNVTSNFSLNLLPE